MQWYSWLDVVYHQILNSYRQNRGHQALLLHSQWNNGENILIRSIACWLICSHPIATKYCNICCNCKLMKIGNHPDYHWFDAKNDVQSVGVDNIRECFNLIYNHVYKSKVKIFVISNIEFLSNQAINVLLKIIEEPPNNIYFFFTSKKYNSIPLTLLSRCVKWSIVAPEEKIGLKWLMQQEKIKINNVLSAICALRLCNGAPLEARNMWISGSWQRRLCLCKSLYSAITYGNFLKIVPLLNVLYYKKLSLYWLITLILDALKWQQKVEKKFIINLDQVELITLIANRWSMHMLVKQLQQWLILFRYLQEFTNINYKLVLTYRVLNWKFNIIEHYLNIWDI